MRKGNLLLLITEIFAGLVGLVSAWGSNCVTFDLQSVISDAGDYKYGIVEQYQWLWYITTSLTYLSAIATVVVVWALISQKIWVYPVALVTAIVGAISGWTPFLLIVMDGGFTPSFMRAVLYTLVLLILIIPAIKRGVEVRIGESADSATLSDSTSKDTTNLAVISVTGIALAISPLIANSTHGDYMIMYGLEYIKYAIFLHIVGLSILALGLFNFLVAKYRNGQASPSPVRM